MEIPRNKLTARVHVAAVAVQQTKISSEKHPSFEGQVCFFMYKTNKHISHIVNLRFFAVNYMYSLHFNVNIIWVEV